MLNIFASPTDKSVWQISYVGHNSLSIEEILFLILSLLCSKIFIGPISLKQHYWLRILLTLFVSNCFDPTIRDSISEVTEIMIIVDVYNLLILLGLRYPWGFSIFEYHVNMFGSAIKDAILIKVKSDVIDYLSAHRAI